MPRHEAVRIPIMLDRERFMVFDFNALSLAEGVTGKNYMQAEVWQAPSFSDLRALIYGGLKQDDPKLTVEDVGAMLNLGNIEEITKQLEEARQANWPEPDEAEPTEEKEGSVPFDSASPGTKSISPPAGPSPATTSS